VLCIAPFYTFAGGKKSAALKWAYAKEGHVGPDRGTQLDCGFRVVDLVGSAVDDSDCCFELVDRLSKRVVCRLSSKKI
jgi:hypothetical protein